MEKITVKNAEQIVLNYKTKHKQGFVRTEMMDFIKKYGFDETKFCNALGVCTGMVIKGDFITYHSDIITAVMCLLQKRGIRLHEFD